MRQQPSWKIGFQDTVVIRRLYHESKIDGQRNGHRRIDKDPARGEYSVDSKVRYLKVLEYQYFCPHFVFHRLPDGSREKEIKQFIDVSVVLFLE